MVKADKRDSQNYRIKNLTFPTCFYDDESITSWLVRAALNQGCSPLTFTQFYFGNYRFWTYDLDKGFNHIDQKIHHNLSILAGVSRQKIEDISLANFAINLGYAKSMHKISIPWVLPLYKRNRRSLLGYQYCPLCMKHDGGAYLKKSWRFSYHVYCITHQLSLHNKCSFCNLPYQPQLLESQDRYINRCHSCKKTLATRFEDKREPQFNHSVYDFQLLTDSVLKKGVGRILGREVAIADWFNAVAFFINLIRRGANSPSYMLGRLINSFGIYDYQALVTKTGLSFDCLPCEERINLLSGVYKLISAPLEQWCDACAENKLTKNSFHWSKNMQIPTGFLPVYQHLPEMVVRNKKQPEVKNEKPRSKKAVMRMWARLQRKLELAKAYENSSCKR